MKIPKKITSAWLNKNGYKLVNVYRNGYRLAVLKSVGRKWSRLTVLATGDNFKLPNNEQELKEVVRKSGRWVTA